ncbi:MAG: nucleoside deaminase [Acutalibacteraceae bacterium]
MRGFIKADEGFMLRAIELAEEAGKNGEIPVGAVVVRNGEIIGEGRNRRESQNLVSGHAELEALDAAAKRLGDWRLSGCEMYVTLEPCPMCAAAVFQSRISALIYGAADIYGGAAGGKINMFAYDFVQNPPSVLPFFKKDECEELLKEFFLKKRRNLK